MLLNGYLSTGDAVSNLPKLLEENNGICILEGYKQVIDSTMPETSESEYLDPAYTEDEQFIYRQWQVKQFSIS